jgi:hypothetical protein
MRRGEEDGEQEEKCFKERYEDLEQDEHRPQGRRCEDRQESFQADSQETG